MGASCRRKDRPACAQAHAAPAPAGTSAPGATKASVMCSGRARARPWLRVLWRTLRALRFVSALALLLLGPVSLPTADPGPAAFGTGTSSVTAPGTSPGPGVGRPPARPPVSPKAPPPSAQPFEDGTYLVIEARPPHARVFLNDRFLGTASQVAPWLIPVLPGSHMITVTAAGFRPYRTYNHHEAHRGADEASGQLRA